MEEIARACRAALTHARNRLLGLRSIIDVCSGCSRADISLTMTAAAANNDEGRRAMDLVSAATTTTTLFCHLHERAAHSSRETRECSNSLSFLYCFAKLLA